MKRLLILISTCLVLSISFGQNPRYDTIRYARKHYEKRMALFNSEPVRAGRIIFLGNSITEFADWKNLLNDSTVVNRGIAADNTFGVLDRLDDVIIRKPSKLFVKIGINDISQNIPVNIIVQNISTIARRVIQKSPQTKVFIHSILPTNDNVKTEYPDAFDKNDKVKSVNEELMRIAKSNGFIYVDLNKELSDRDGKLDVKYANSDGLHLNKMGYQVWVNLLKSKKYI